MTREEKVLKEGNRIICEYFGAPDIDKLHSFQFGTRWADAHPRNPWRALIEELPPVKQRVFFLDINGIPHIGRREISEQIIVSADTPQENIIITHWMPIPETPKGGAE